MVEDSDGYVNLRGYKGTDYEIIGKVNNGDVVHAIYENNDEWVCVITSGNLIG